MDKLYIIAPVYNEEKNIESFVDEWYPVVEAHNTSGESKLVVINDGSKDNTFNILERLVADRPLLHLIHKKNGGHGSAVLCGYKFAVERGADYVFQTDSDGQTDPNEFEEFWNHRSDYDAIIGARPDRQDGIGRKLVEMVLLFILKGIFGVSIPDSNAPFRLMKKELLNKYISKLPENFNLPNVMLTTYFAYYNDNIKFVNISFNSRRGGGELNKC